METFKGGLTMNTYIPEEIELQKYFNDISKYGLLTKKEEQGLFKVMHKWKNKMSNCGQRARLKGRAEREK